MFFSTSLLDSNEESSEMELVEKHRKYTWLASILKKRKM